MKVVLIVLLLSFYSPFLAQDTLLYGPNVCEKVVFSDRTTQSELFQFRIAYLFQKDKQKINHTTEVHNVAQVILLLPQSFMEDSLNQQLRPFAQLCMDAYQFNLIQFQAELNREDQPTHLCIKSIQLGADELIQQITLETNSGADKNAMKRWREKFASSLYFPSEPDFSAYLRDQWELTYGIGVSTVAIRQDFAPYLTTGLGFTTGGAFAIKRLQFSGNYSYQPAQGKLAYYAPDFKFNDTNQLAVVQTLLQGGFQLVRKRKCTVAVEGGVNLFRVLNTDEAKGALSRNGPISGLGVASLYAEYRFVNTYKTNDFAFFWKVYARISYGKGKFAQQITLEPVSLNIGLGFTLYGIKNEWE